jgi:hypothetical protein
MKDFCGNELNVGDQVVFIRKENKNSWLAHGIVEKIHAKMITISSGGMQYKTYPQDRVYRIPGS